MEQQERIASAISENSPGGLTEMEQAALNLVIDSRLAGQFPLGDEEIIIQTAQIWSKVLDHAKIPLKFWDECLLHAMSTHTSKFPLHIGAVVEAYEAVVNSHRDNRTILQKIRDFNGSRAPGIGDYGIHLDFTTHLKNMLDLRFKPPALVEYFQKEYAGQSHRLDWGLVAELTAGVKTTPDMWDYLQENLPEVQIVNRPK